MSTDGPFIIRISAKNINLPNFKRSTGSNGSKGSTGNKRTTDTFSKGDLSSHRDTSRRRRDVKGGLDALDKFTYQDLEDCTLLLLFDEATDTMMEFPFELFDVNDILNVVVTCAGTLGNFDRNRALELATILQEKKTKAKVETWLNLFFQPPKILAGKSKLVAYDALLLDLIQKKEHMHGKYYRVVQKLQSISEKLQSAESRLSDARIDKQREKLQQTIATLETELESYSTDAKVVAVQAEWNDLLHQIETETRRAHGIVSEKVRGLRNYIDLMQTEIRTYCHVEDVEDVEDVDLKNKDNGPVKGDNGLDIDVVDVVVATNKKKKKRARKGSDDDDDEDIDNDVVEKESHDDEWEAMDLSSDEESDSSSEEQAGESREVCDTDSLKGLIKRCSGLSQDQKSKLVKSLFTKSALLDIIKTYQ